ncbi:hypothetical protein VP1G_10298 [Cytospora mali]|uniref:Pre-mRNA splicing factor CLF1 n=1 Tax=Cytospora mali TaxID=578113 RepID=A0A194VHC2_CYTMA|nr:hypothetical protein VP1G_10298 [Valsa mali var. pyri (nom. inval.)]
MPMGQPQPKVALNGICSVLYNNTLYAYSADAFQSLELETGAEWQTLKQGEAVSGAACVGSSSGLYVVGGTGGSDGYKGLQKYTYATGTWESITPVVAVTENRTDHGAVYLEGSDSIVVYAGSQDGVTGYSTQTFSIAASEPYSVLAYESEGAPPTNKPILLAWSDQQAVMVGGSATNTEVMLFTVGSGWSNSGATLASPLKTGSDPWQAALVTGDDGSKNLYTFDMSVSPNVANRTVLVNQNGAPVTDAVAITKRSDEDGWAEEYGLERRTVSLTQSTWPTYNSTYASTATRSDYSSAGSSDGQVVIAGGNTEDVLCIFNARANSWVNATELLVSEQKPLSLSSTSMATSSSATATSTSFSGTLSATNTAETTAAAGTSSSKGSSSSSSGLSSNGVLGAVLGSVGGVLVFLMLVYCQIRKRKRRQDFIQAGHARRSSGLSGEPEKDGMAMATESFPRSPTNGTFMRGHQPKGSTGSFSSMAILMGRNKETSVEGGGRPSFGNNRSAMGHTGPMPPPPTYLSPDARDEKGVSFAADTVDPRVPSRVPADQQEGVRRSSGWNRYWSGDSAALNILGYGNGGQQNGQQNSRNTVASEGSHYSNDRSINPLHRITQDSVTVPPLNVDGRPRFNRVNSASPTISNYPAAIRQHLSAEMDDRPPSPLSDISGYSSGIPASVQDSWDPTKAHLSKPWDDSRHTSSLYSNAFPMPPSTPTGQRPSVSQGKPSGLSQQPQLAKAHTSDMSWLNLGEQHQRD